MLDVNVSLNIYIGVKFIDFKFNELEHFQFLTTLSSLSGVVTPCKNYCFNDTFESLIESDIDLSSLVDVAIPQPMPLTEAHSTVNCGLARESM